MKIPFVSAVIFSSALAASCAAVPKTPDVAAAQAGVRALLAEWAEAGSESRWEDLKALYADEPGFAWVEQGVVAYKDRAAVAAGVDAAAATSAQIKTSVADIVATPVAADAAAFHARVKSSVASAEFAFEFDGVISGLAVRRDGRWLFLQGHLSAPTAR